MRKNFLLPYKITKFDDVKFKYSSTVDRKKEVSRVRVFCRRKVTI